MPYKKSKYSPQYNAEKKVAIIEVLSKATHSMTIDDIKAQDVTLANMTTQKAARLLSELVDMGLVAKGKDRVTNRNCYKAIGKMVEEGYEIGPERGYEYAEVASVD